MWNTGTDEGTGGTEVLTSSRATDCADVMSCTVHGDVVLSTRRSAGTAAPPVVADRGDMEHAVRSDPTPSDAPLGVPRNLLRDAVFRRLLADILRGTYRRGQRLRLEILANDMQVSRTPVREALVPLETLRLVSVQRYVGVVIAPWCVEHMVERIRIARSMLLDPPTSGPACTAAFDPGLLRECVSEAGALVELGVWVLARSGAPVSADWLRFQQPVLDLFHTDEIARANGIDVAMDRGRRSALVKAARAAALDDDVAGCSALLVELAELLIDLPGRFRTSAAG
jgi:hypothetical protein